MQYCYDGHRTQTGAPAFSRLMLLVKLETFDGAVLILTLSLIFPVSFVVVAIPDDDDGRKMKSKTLSSLQVGIECL